VPGGAPQRAPGPVLVLAVHLCGTLSLRAIDLFHRNANTQARTPRVQAGRMMMH
jgi:hypothetical protein